MDHRNPSLPWPQAIAPTRPLASAADRPATDAEERERARRSVDAAFPLTARLLTDDGGAEEAPRPPQADEALHRARIIQGGPYVPPLDIALDGARRILDEAGRLPINELPAHLATAILATHLGSLQASLRMLADAVDTEVYGRSDA